MKLTIRSFRRIISAGTLLIAFTPACLRAAERIDLDQALAIALKRNPFLAASRSDVDAARAGLTQATAAYYPQLKASAGYDRTWLDLEAETGGTGDLATEITDTYAAGISLSQYLFDFGKTPAEVDRSKKSLAAAEKKFTTVEKTLVRDVTQAYLDVLKNHELVTVDQENLSVRRQLRDQAKALYEQGMRPRIDVTRAETELSQAKLSLVTSQFGGQEATLAFERLLGGPPSSGAYTLAEVAPAPSPTTALSPLIQKGLAARSEIAALQAQLDAAEAVVLAARRSAYPSLNAKGYSEE